MGDRPGPIIAHELQPPDVWINQEGTRGLVILGASISSRSSIVDSIGTRSEVDTTSQSRIYYTTSLTRGEWKISSLTCMYVKDFMVPAIPGQTLTVYPKIVRARRPDVG